MCLKGPVLGFGWEGWKGVAMPWTHMHFHESLWQKRLPIIMWVLLEILPLFKFFVFCFCFCFFVFVCLFVCLFVLEFATVRDTVGPIFINRMFLFFGLFLILFCFYFVWFVFLFFLFVVVVVVFLKKMRSISWYPVKSPSILRPKIKMLDTILETFS